MDDRDQSYLFREEKDEQTYSQTDCYVWLKSGIRKRVALASVFSQYSVWLTWCLLLLGIFVFRVLGVGAEWRSVPFLCLTFNHLSRSMFEVATCG